MSKYLTTSLAARINQITVMQQYGHSHITEGLSSIGGFPVQDYDLERLTADVVAEAEMGGVSSEERRALKRYIERGGMAGFDPEEGGAEEDVTNLVTQLLTAPADKAEELAGMVELGAISDSDDPDDTIEVNYIDEQGAVRRMAFKRHKTRTATRRLRAKGAKAVNATVRRVPPAKSGPAALPRFARDATVPFLSVIPGPGASWTDKDGPAAGLNPHYRAEALRSVSDVFGRILPFRMESPAPVTSAGATVSISAGTTNLSNGQSVVAHHLFFAVYSSLLSSVNGATLSIAWAGSNFDFQAISTGTGTDPFRGNLSMPATGSFMAMLTLYSLVRSVPYVSPARMAKQYVAFGSVAAAANVTIDLSITGLPSGLTAAMWVPGIASQDTRSVVVSG